MVKATVPKGLDKPYSDRSGVIWLKAGADKRRIDSKEELRRLLRNMNLATETGMLNLAGLLLFGEEPERYKPQFAVKAVRCPGDAIHASAHEDTEDFGGPLPRVFDGALAFTLRNLHKVQAGRGVHSPGHLPDSPTADGDLPKKANGAEASPSAPFALVSEIG